MANAVKTIVAKPVKHKMSLSERVKAKAVHSKVINGAVVLDPNNPSHVEWWNDDKAGDMCK